MTTTLDRDASAVTHLPMPPVNRRALAEFVALFSGLTDDHGFRTREHGDLIRIIPPTGKFRHFFNLWVEGWTGETVLITCPRATRQIFTLPPDTADFEGNKRWLRLAMGANSPFVLGGRDHVTVRQAIVPELTVAMVERYRERSVEVLDAMIDRLRVGTPLSLHDFYAAFAQEMILRVTFGLDDRSELDTYRRWLNRAATHATAQNIRRALAYSAGSAVALRGGNDELPRFLRRGRQIRRQSDLMIQRELDRLRAHPNDSVASRLLARQRSDPDFWTDKVLRDVIATLLLAGHDTSVNAYAWASEYLLHDARPRDLLVAEALEARTDAYAQAITTEAVRMKPPVWGMQATTKQDTEIAGRRIRRGTWVFMLASAIHYDEDIYPDARTFLPERFLATTPDRYGMIAFSAGRHRCPGTTFFNTEANIVLHRMFGRLEMEPCLPCVDRTYMGFGFFNRPKHGTRVVVRSRKPASEVPIYRPATTETTRHSALHTAMLAETDQIGSDRCPVAH